MSYSGEIIPLIKVSQLNSKWSEVVDRDDTSDQTVLDWLNEWEDDFDMIPSTVEYWETEGDQALSEHINFVEYLTNK